ncbi:MAG: FliI/YscN family ATPase [Geminicoccaceae bacterium]
MEPSRRAGLAALEAQLAHLPTMTTGGYLRGCRGGAAIVSGLAGRVAIGDGCRIERPRGRRLEVDRPFPRASGTLAEVVGFDISGAVLVPYDEPVGLVAGARVAIDHDAMLLHPDPSWQGRVLDGFARPLDGGAPLRRGPRSYPLRGRPPAATERSRVGPRLSLGVRALDLFTPCCLGQRLGIFAGSGVGKSTLMAMIAAAAEADVLVIGLVGERGRELNEFLADTLGEAGRRRSVVVVATSDEPAMLRRRAAYVTLTVAEAFRDKGLRVLCLMDSVTRFAMALREIYLAAGEVPTSRGYPPGVFTELPRLLERAGPGTGEGSITGLFTVLVDGDDTNEPISDAVRGILDGHVILDRAIAEEGRFPAVDVLRSLSRTAPGCYAPEEREPVREARRLLRVHADMAELIRLGVYKPGADPLVDRAVAVKAGLEELLQQAPDETHAAAESFADLRKVLALAGGGA